MVKLLSKMDMAVKTDKITYPLLRNHDNTLKLFEKIVYFASGVVCDEALSALKNSNAESTLLISDSVTHCIVGKNYVESDVNDARELYNITTVTPEWIRMSVLCNKLLPTKPFNPFENNLFTGITICVSQLAANDCKTIWALVTYNGGTFGLKLVLSKTTHLVVTKTAGKKYDAVLSSGSNNIKIVTPDWIIDCVKHNELFSVTNYHPKLLLMPKLSPIKQCCLSQSIDLSTITGFDAPVEPTTDELKSLQLKQLIQRLPWNQPSILPKSQTIQHSPLQMIHMDTESYKQMQAMNPAAQLEFINKLSKQRNLIFQQSDGRQHQPIGVTESANISGPSTRISQSTILDTLNTQPLSESRILQAKQELWDQLCQEQFLAQQQQQQQQKLAGGIIITQLPSHVKTRSHTLKNNFILPHNAVWEKSTVTEQGAWRIPNNVTQELFDQLNNTHMPFNRKLRRSNDVYFTEQKNNDLTMAGIITKNINVPSIEHRPCVLLVGFGIGNEEKRMVLKLGGTIAKYYLVATHLVMKKPVVTTKFLCCISTVKYILTADWLKDSYTQHSFLGELIYTVNEISVDQEVICEVPKVLSNPNRHKLFKEKIFYVTPGITLPSATHKRTRRAVLIVQHIIESAGGTIENRRRSLNAIQELEPNTYIIITCKNDLHLIDDLVQSFYGIYNSEFVLYAVMTQYLDYNISQTKVI